MSVKKILFKVRYLQLGRYKTTLMGYIDSWSDMGIVLLDQDKRRHTLQPGNVIKIEPVYLPKEQVPEVAEETMDGDVQMDIFEQFVSNESK